MTPVAINDEDDRNDQEVTSTHFGIKIIIIHSVVIAYFSYTTYKYISTREFNYFNLIAFFIFDFCRRQMHSRLYFDSLLSIWNAVAGVLRHLPWAFLF